ncbi:MAG TPA: type II CAAX endopeptidase family protein [Dyella sp.]|uniref:CPBP family intramembrane glutamic endopeptidase n=1 Tax=Dyella sp. TaxID=1869338 RepID=UPI002F92659D
MDTDIALDTRTQGQRPVRETTAPGGWPAVGMIVLYFLLQALFATLFASAASLAVLLGGSTDRANLGPAIKILLGRPDIGALLVAVALCGAAATMLWLVRLRWPTLWPLAQPPGFGWSAPSSGVFYVYAIAAGVVLPVLGGYLTHFLAQGHPVPQDIKLLSARAPQAYKALLAMLAIIVAPLVEEVLFRGVLLSAWLRRLPVAWAVAATATLFALVHLPDLKYLWYGLPNLAMLGAAFAWLRLRSGSLWPAVVAHGMNNLVSLLGVFFAAHGV